MQKGKLDLRFREDNFNPNEEYRQALAAHTIDLPHSSREQRKLPVGWLLISPPPPKANVYSK